MKDITTNFAKLFSYVFHPLLMPTLGIVLIFTSGTYLSYLPFEGIRLIFLLTFLGTFIIPLSFIPLYYYFSIIKNAEMETSDQRIIPLVITFITYCCTFYLMRKIPIPFINSFIMACCAVLLLNTIVIQKWKISSHLLGLGGLTGLVLALNIRLNADISLFFILLIFVTGLVATSRLKLNVHSPAQVYAGYFLGLFVVSFFLLVL